MDEVAWHGTIEEKPDSLLVSMGMFERTVFSIALRAVWYAFVQKSTLVARFFRLCQQPGVV